MFAQQFTQKGLAGFPRHRFRCGRRRSFVPGFPKRKRLGPIFYLQPRLFENVLASKSIRLSIEQGVNNGAVSERFLRFCASMSTRFDFPLLRHLTNKHKIARGSTRKGSVRPGKWAFSYRVFHCAIRKVLFTFDTWKW